jgi:hypothetical protein
VTPHLQHIGAASVGATTHLQHILEALAFMVVVIGGIAVAEAMGGRRRRRGEQPDPPRASRTERARPMVLLPLVGVGSAAAAAVHLVVMPQHFEESVLYGMFFATVASCQVALAVITLGWPSRTLLIAGLLGNLSVVVIWLLTRTVAIPLGPAAGTTEGFAGLDTLATTFEVTVVAASIALLRRPNLRSALHPSTWSPLVWPVAVLAAVAIPISNWIAPAVS